MGIIFSHITFIHMKNVSIKKMFAAAFAVAALGGSAHADVPELRQLVPEAKGYELVYKFNPVKYASEGYQIDNSENISGKITRLGYLLKTVSKDGKTVWVFASFDPFSQNLADIGVPDFGTGTFQTYVNNLEVAGNGNVKTGKFEKGNIEFWPYNYGGQNAKNIPNATGAFDFGDSVGTDGGYGSMQIHNFLQKETVIAFNAFKQGQPDIGIGNCPEGNPDWTFSKSAAKLSSAEMYVVAKFENATFTKSQPIDVSKISFSGTSEKLDYAPNEEMVFTFKVDFGGQPAPKSPYKMAWERRGDDGATESGTCEISPEKPAVLKTKLGQDGFVKIFARLMNSRGKTIETTVNGKKQAIDFNGGAGVNITRLKNAVAEPADFDAFWAKQKAKLAKVPLKYKMEKVSKDGANVDVYAVSVDCAGSRPVTGYLTIPANAREKSLPANVSFHGYGTHIQRAPQHSWGGAIRFDINAHGYDLGKDEAYYEEFFKNIKSNGQIYAFDPKQNSNPEEAYFNGMVLRVMRALEFVKSLPQWNGKELVVEGGSQGGLQTAWAAALDSDVTLAKPNITWCCDFAGDKVGKRLGGWRPQYVPALDYYDAAFHAKRIRCKTDVTRAGVGDYVCPPSGLAVFYNNITAPKRIKWVQGSTHGFVPKKPQVWIIEDGFED